ncbi:hypothetical protein [Thiocapsa roseopersicina]|uniref:Uncharacterized protein n=1 Tax=Thiocapsa roseopersicina TaxID=1058 RepID=A0A1H3CJN6_THIRO|nr:hypothetical protein [Thiocapsa roseopersicina]SDX54472.1 hypothetical protein SAMN05421783_1358 [Thiocapsa roseopersicina]
MSETETKKNELTAAIGLRLRAERHRRRLSLSQLAARTDGAISKSCISNYEHGIRRLGRALGDVTPTTSYVSTTTTPLSDAERTLLARYRASNVRRQARILAAAESEATRSQGQCAHAA